MGNCGHRAIAHRLFFLLAGSGPAQAGPPLLIGLYRTSAPFTIPLMRVQVKPLRHHGARLTDHQIASLVPIEGALRVYGLGGSIQVSVSAPDDQQGKPLLPDLYDARIVTLQNNGMLFFGLERTGNPAAAQYAQEWSVRIVSL